MEVLSGFSDVVVFTYETSVRLLKLLSHFAGFINWIRIKPMSSFNINFHYDAHQVDIKFSTNSKYKHLKVVA